MITTQKELRDEFWLQHPQFILHFRAKKKQNDYITDIRVAWVDFVDHMRACGQISEKLTEKATL